MYIQKSFNVFMNDWDDEFFFEQVAKAFLVVGWV